MRKTTSDRQPVRVKGQMRWWAGYIAPLLLATGLLGILGLPGRLAAQTGASATPIPISLASPTPFNADPATTPSPTWTATALSLAVLTPRDVANVRAEPSTDAAQLGTIRAGETYTVTGRYFEWYQIQYSGAATGRGWVFGGIVDVTGEVSTIPEVTLEPAPTQDPSQAAATQTLEAIVLTPGGAETATIAARGIVSTIQLPAQGGSASTPLPGGTLLPTFTFPPGMAALAPGTTPVGATAPTDPAGELEITSETLSSIPPLVPIAALGILGAVGLALTTFRRK